MPPEAEGYTERTIKEASEEGKRTVYIVPLQEELSLEALSSDSKEFTLMPKTPCKRCNTVMPLQLLALHIQDSAGGNTNSSESEDEVPHFGWDFWTPVTV